MATQRPRASRLQFSLRAVLVVLTLVAIAGWWWQKRFRVESTVRQRQASDSAVQVVELAKTESKRRKGLGDAVLDGPTTVVNAEGTIILEEQWRQGIRHGIYRRWNDAGELLFECEFKRGRLIRVGDIAVVDFMPSAAVADDLNGQRICRALHFETTFDYLDQPLKDVVEDISFNHNIPIMIDAREFADDGIDIETPITSTIRGVPLFVALVELLAPLDLTCAYRYEMLWVTTPGSDLHDDELAPRVITDHASSELLSRLSNPATIDYLAQPLGPVLEDLGFTHGIKIEHDLQDESEQVTLSIRTNSLRSGLGMLLYSHELRCEAIRDKLVITEVEGKKPRPKASRDALLSPDPATNSFSDPASDPFADPTGKDAPRDN